MGGNDFLEGGDATLLGRGWGQRVISRIRLLCNNLLERVFQTVPSSFDLHCICIFDAENVKLLWFAPLSLH